MTRSTAALLHVATCCWLLATPSAGHAAPVTINYSLAPGGGNALGIALLPGPITGGSFSISLNASGAGSCLTGGSLVSGTGACLNTFQFVTALGGSAAITAPVFWTSPFASLSGAAPSHTVAFVANIFTAIPSLNAASIFATGGVLGFAIFNFAPGSPGWNVITPSSLSYIAILPLGGGVLYGLTGQEVPEPAVSQLSLSAGFLALGLYALTRMQRRRLRGHATSTDEQAA